MSYIGEARCFKRQAELLRKAAHEETDPDRRRALESQADEAWSEYQCAWQAAAQEAKADEAYERERYYEPYDYADEVADEDTEES